MVIDYEKYPALKLLSNDETTFPFLDVDAEFFGNEGCKVFKEYFDENKVHFKKEIFFISETFINAALKNHEKFLKIINELSTDLELELIIEATYVVKNEVYFINFKKQSGSLDRELTFYTFRDEFPLLCLIDEKAWVTKPLEEGAGAKLYIDMSLHAFLLFSLFKKYATVETKTLFPKRKVVDGKEKHLNNTDLNITKLDCVWFTNLVRTDGFGVRGHFRLQPCIKDGKWTKELIWINDFQKNGYTRKATKLKTESNEDN